MKSLIVLTIVSMALAACGKEDKPPSERAAAASAAETARITSPAVPETVPAENRSASAKAASPNSPASRRAAASVAASGLPNATHTVARGETLASIAKSRGLKAADVAQWNSVRDPRRLRIGQKLRLTAP